MKKVTVKVRTPSFKRLWRLFWRLKGLSILRILEYERFSELQLTGRILDFGGGEKANYSGEIANWGDKKERYIFESVNISPEIEPTYLIDERGEIPVERERYDAVISLNTFEHVLELEHIFKEIRRVLKPGGHFIFTVPFIFRVHGHPDDYLRGTPSFWNNFLLKHGFKDIQIETLQWGPFSTALTISGVPGPLKILRKYLVLILDVFYYTLRYGQDTILYETQDFPLCNAPLGYFIQSYKK